VGSTDTLWTLSAREIVDGIAAGRFTARDVVSATLARIEAVNGKVNALVSVQAEDALARADELDAHVAAGKPLLPLHGVPVTTKVNTDQRGLPTTNGTHFFANKIAADDDACVANLRKAGAVLIGRSNAPAMSMRWTTENDVHGRTLNPWNAAVVPGGSSGGAGVAVAIGLGPIAHGNDGGGSIRMPAFCAGVVGLRPTVGRIPAAAADEAQGRSFAAGLISTQGPLGRTAEDVRMSFAAMAAPSERDPVQVPVPFDPAAHAEPCRVALCVDPTGTGVDDWTAASLRLAAERLQAAGYAVLEAAPPQFGDAVELWHAIASQARNAMGPFIETHGDEGARILNRRVQQWNTFEPGRFIAALDRRTGLQKAWDRFLRDHPLLLIPVMNGKPFAVGYDSSSEAAMHEMFRLLAPMLPASSLGYPAASVPTAVLDGLPGGVQLMAARFDEARILHAAAIVQGDFLEGRPIDPKS
jgi:amidase